MTLTAPHPVVDLAVVVHYSDWEVGVSPNLAETAPPTAEELRVLREELDPQGVYSR